MVSGRQATVLARGTCRSRAAASVACLTLRMTRSARGPALALYRAVVAALAFVGGRVLTMEPGGQADALIVEGDRISAVGPRSILDSRPDAEVVDLAGRTLLPGFIDAHNHLSLAALEPRWADLSQAEDAAAIRTALVEQAGREPEADWIRGFGWSARRDFPLSRHDLDDLGLDRPVIVAHFSLHQAVTDSRGLDALQVGVGTPDPAGGVIRRDEAGRPKGLLIERAWSLAHERSLAGYDDPDRWGELIGQRARSLVAEGITCVHDAACPPAAEAIYARMAGAGALPISVLAMPHPAALLSGLDPHRLDGPPTGEGDEWFRIGALKLFADGGIALSIDAHVGGQPVRTGLGFADLYDGVDAAVSRGFAVAVHAMGNAGLEATLDAFADAARAHPGWDQRFRVEHVTLATGPQLDRMAELGVIGVVQPGFVEAMGLRIGDLRFDDATWLPFASALERGVTLAGSSDDPCAPRAPLKVSPLGASRRTSNNHVLHQEESVALEDWLRAYTLGAATAGGQDTERGTLRAGKRADLVALDGELERGAAPPVWATWVAGELAFCRS
jgi:predicted amidohydrolase YtcJ